MEAVQVREKGEYGCNKSGRQRQRKPKVEGPALACSGYLAGLYGRGGVQARGPGLIFLKYISDAFDELRARLEAECHLGVEPENSDEYRA